MTHWKSVAGEPHLVVIIILILSTGNSGNASNDDGRKASAVSHSGDGGGKYSRWPEVLQSPQGLIEFSLITGTRSC
jgi:hypothetical protein